MGGFANIVDCTGHTPQLSVLCVWEREWVVLPTLWTVLDIHLSCQCCESGRESGWFCQHCGLYWTYTSAVSAVCLGERVGGFANIVDCTGHTPQLSVLCVWEREWVVSPTLWTVLDIHLSCQCCVSGRESGWFRQHCGLYWTYTSDVSAVSLGERVGGFANIVDCTGHTPQLSVL